MHGMGAFWARKMPREGHSEIFGTKLGEHVPWVERGPGRHGVRFGGPNFFWEFYLIKIEICIIW